VNIGKMVEEMEIKLRSLLQEVYFSKTKDILNSLRSVEAKSFKKSREEVRGELVGLLRNRNKGKEIIED